MGNRVIAAVGLAVLLGLIPAAGHALVPYAQDFEGLVYDDPDALAEDGWLVYGNVYTPGGEFLYGYGPFPAPNHNLAFSQIVLGEGGPDQGEQVLSVFSDYENGDHANGNLIESNVYQEWAIEAEDVAHMWEFAFQAKRGNIELGVDAVAFIKTLDPNNGYATTNFVTVDMRYIPDFWSGYAMRLTIDPSLVGQILQIGFANTATDYDGSGIFYDNLVFQSLGTVDAPEDERLVGTMLHQNYPNPFHPTTRIDFSLSRSGPVDLSVFDPAGRRIATLYQGDLAAGRHHAVWNGTTSHGDPVSSGIYFYTLKTASGEISGRMVLAE
ncbi:MAG: T9SS type A sorting domain-containing protein [Candidatus Latescibacteria bacterium]|nr:T9SS type A sorting domain-containing protein [Candidatus Latescibacterota bacterium]